MTTRRPGFSFLESAVLDAADAGTRVTFTSPPASAAPLAAGDRVKVLVGGYKDYAGRILSVVHRYADIQPSVSVYLDNGQTVMGYMPCDLRRLA